MKAKQYSKGYQLRPEDKVQIACVQTAKLMKIPVFHIPNGIDIPHPLTRIKYQKMGLEAGIPDLFMPMPFVVGDPHSPYIDENNYRRHGLFVECKAGKNKPTAEQLLWHERLRSWGYAVYTVWSQVEFEALMFKCYPTFAKRFAHFK